MSKKRNSYVDGVRIENSGVANYIITVDPLTARLNDYLSHMQPIEYFAVHQDIFFVCKALNYYVREDKWEGDRDLAVYVNWSVDPQKKIHGDLVYEHPLQMKGNCVGAQIKRLLSELQIDRTNFHALRQHLHVSVKCHE